MAESEKRLQFLLSLMEVRGVSKHELARIMGVSPQNIFTYFKRDDMKLSVAQEMASRLGYDLSYRLEKDGAMSSRTSKVWWGRTESSGSPFSVSP